VPTFPFSAFDVILTAMFNNSCGGACPSYFYQFTNWGTLVFVVAVLGGLPLATFILTRLIALAVRWGVL